MAWTTPRTWVSTEVVTASIMNTHVRDNFNATAPAVATSAGSFIVNSATNTVVARRPETDEINTSESTTSTSYTDLSTSGPAVTVTCSARALVIWSALMNNNTGGSVNYMSYAISGATTQSAADTRSAVSESGAANDTGTRTGYQLVTVTGGSNTFTAKYRVNANTGSFNYRKLTVIPL